MIIINCPKSVLHWATFAAVALSAGVFIFSQAVDTYAAVESEEALAGSLKINSSELSYPGEKHVPIKVKGLYLTAYSAGNPKKISEIIKLINETELNSIIIDIKDYSGYIFYKSDLPFVKSIKAEDVRIKNLSEVLNNLKKNHIYTIARISVFQDPLLAEKKSDWALKTKTGALWRDRKGLAWVDPSKKEVWNYVVSVAKEAAQLGFDEINFDYIRFPTDGKLDEIVYPDGLKKYQVVENFFKYATAELATAPVYLSADLFGLTTERSGTNDMLIGQRLADAVKYFDYVMPMVYPSHYPAKYMNFSNPADHPYEVVYNAMLKGVLQADGRKAKLRAWLQAFNLGAIYDGEKIRSQINAADDAGADGWILWNAANRYTDAGLQTK